MAEILLGFQLRIYPENIQHLSAEWRKTYLLREDIEFPLSIDVSVWNYYEDNFLLSNIYANYSGGSLRENVPNGLFIFDLKDSSVLNNPSHYDGALLIGITVVNDSLSIAQRLKAVHRIKDIQYTIAELNQVGWHCIGYDIADEWLLSGLMNIGFNSIDKASLSRRFKEDINKYGLIDSIDIAQEYCIHCNEHIPEHAPFAVYGIWTKNTPNFRETT